MEQLPEYTIRTMSRQEIDLAVEWAAAEGWNPGLEDAECFYQADPEGFLVGLIDSEPVSCISVVRYGESSGFLGFYIVKPEYRGKGLGLELWKAGLKRLEGRVVGLDGVVAQQDNYRKSGFALAYRNVRYLGLSRKATENLQEAVPLSEIPFEPNFPSYYNEAESRMVILSFLRISFWVLVSSVRMCPYFPE
jgi:ribosomal protein S18 acetylase RimI-like enzyme